MKGRIAISAAYILTLLAMSYFGLFLAAPVEAKQQQPEPCVEIAVIGNIHTLQCWDLDNQPYLQNTMGFMTR